MGFLAGFLFGLFFFIAFGAYRALSDPEWDDSNITNFLRLLAHVFLHPGDFGKVYYVTDEMIHDMRWSADITPKQPFWYINQDELSEVVKTRP